MWTIVQLNSRQSGKQTAEEAKEKKKEIMVEKNLEHVGGGGGGSKWAEWLNIQAIATHAKQNSKEKYENTCLVRYENKN